MRRASSKTWAAVVLLALASQFTGPLSGVASAFVGPIWLPVSQAQPEVEEAEPGSDPSEEASPEAAPSEDAPAPEGGTEPVADEGGAPGAAAANEGCADTDLSACVADFVDCATTTDPSLLQGECAEPAAAGVAEEAAELVPSEEQPCAEVEAAEKLACVLGEVRDEACPGETEGPQCTAIDLVANCLDADTCGPGEVIAPVAAGVCGALGEEPEPGEGEEPAPTCEEHLQNCEQPASAACKEALDYLGLRVEEAVCEAGSLDCAPLAQVRGLLACEDKAGCAFQAVWDEATPVLCGQVGASDQQECGDTLDGCDMPDSQGCDDAADYLSEQLEERACKGHAATCGVRDAAESCTDTVAAGEPDGAAVCDDAVYTAVWNAVCATAGTEGCAPAGVDELHDCVTWDGAPSLDECVLPAVVTAVCDAQPIAECPLEKPSVQALLDLPFTCAGAPSACPASIQKVALSALCAEAQGCFPTLEDCSGAACAPLVMGEACEKAGTQVCNEAVRELRVCVDPATTSRCQAPGFWVKWIGMACAGDKNAAENSACPRQAFVAPPVRQTAPDGTTVEVPSPFANGSKDFPYRTIGAAITAVVTSAGTAGNPGSPAIKGPIKVNPGTYKEHLTIPASVPLEIQRLGAQTAEVRIEPSSPAGIRLADGHNLVFSRPVDSQGNRQDTGTFTVLGSPQISGPTATTTLTLDRSRMYVGHGAGLDVTYAHTNLIAIPEQVRYQLLLEGPGASKETVKVQSWNGSAWVDLAYTNATVPTVELYASAPDAAAPSRFSGAASVRVVGTAPMGLTITGRLIGAVTGAVYASAATPYIEAAEVPDAPVPPVATPRTDADDAPPTVRLSGEDRAATAAAVSRESFPDGADAVFVATGASYADALAGGPAAAKSGSPVVLVERDSVPEATRAELARLAPEQVRLLGGTGAISEEVEKELAATGADVSRLRGDSRYATAAAVSAAHFAPGVPVVYIASGEGFADALSGGAAAAALGGPVLLVQPDAVPSATEQELQRLSPGRIVVLGGKQAVSETVEAQLRASGSEVRRVSGATRYATSAAVSRDAFSGTRETVFVATGATFPDALAGVPAAGALKAPLMLVETDRLPAEVAAELDRLRPKRIVILGGQDSVSQRLERELRSYQIP